MTRAQATAEPSLSQEELDALLALVALYPDGLLSHLLMASTYPLEVVQAERFIRQSPPDFGRGGPLSFGARGPPGFGDGLPNGGFHPPGPPPGPH